MLAGQPGVIKFTSISGYGDDVTLAGAVKIRGESVPFEATSDTLTIPALPPGVWRYAVLINGSTAWRGSLMVEDSPLIEDGGQTVWAGTVSKSDDVLDVTISFGVQGPAGPQGADGASAYDIWLAAGNSGTEEEFLASLVGPQGDPGEPGDPGQPGEPGEPGETGPSPEHEWQGTSLRFQNPDGTWGALVDLQGPQGEAGTGGGGSITIDDTPTQGSDNAVSSGGVYNYLRHPNVALGEGAYPLPSSYNCSVSIGTWANASGFASAAIGADAKSYADNAIAIGVGTVAEAESSCVLGGGGYIADTGVTVINAGGEITDGKSTQLYLIPAGSDMANRYMNGDAGLGFAVLDHLSGSVVARGTIPLASICTQHTSDFSPTGVTSIKAY